MGILPCGESKCMNTLSKKRQRGEKHGNKILKPEPALHISETKMKWIKCR